MSDDSTSEDTIDVAADGTAFALDDSGTEEVSNGGGAESPDESVEVAVVVACSSVLVRVIVEVESSVVVGSAPEAPASRAASDIRGKETRA